LALFNLQGPPDRHGGIGLQILTVRYFNAKKREGPIPLCQSGALGKLNKAKRSYETNSAITKFFLLDVYFSFPSPIFSFGVEELVNVLLAISRIFLTATIF